MAALRSDHFSFLDDHFPEFGPQAKEQASEMELARRVVERAPASEAKPKPQGSHTEEDN